MNDAIKNAVMNAPEDLNAMMRGDRSPSEEQIHRKQRLAAALRIFGKCGFDEGVAGHFTVRDPIEPETFWVNAMGVSFKQMRVSDLLRVSHDGQVLEGHGLLNAAAFVIHSNVHSARPDVVAAAHAHSLYGKTWSSLGRFIDPITQDACAFFEDHALFDDYTGVVVDMDEGQRLGNVLGDNKTLILQNHGHLTVGQTIEEACWWFVTFERSCQAQLLAEAAGTPKLIPDTMARHTKGQVGSSFAGWFSGQPMFDVIFKEQPDLVD